MRKSNALYVHDFVIEDASYYRTSNVVEGAGAVAHCDGVATIYDDAEEPVQILFRTGYNPASNRFSARTIPMAEIPADVLHNAAIEWVHHESWRAMCADAGTPKKKIVLP